MLVFNDFFFLSPELLGKWSNSTLAYFLKWLVQLNHQLVVPSEERCRSRCLLQRCHGETREDVSTTKGAAAASNSAANNLQKIFIFVIFWVLRFLGPRCVIDWLLGVSILSQKKCAFCPCGARVSESQKGILTGPNTVQPCAMIIDFSTCPNTNIEQKRCAFRDPKH